MTGPTDAQSRTVAGRYRLTTVLGSGAMGTVWSGFDEVLQRPVAVKELKVPRGVPSQEADSLRERMLREARALGGLSHPNVVMVFDVVDVDGNPFVVLELLPSRNLSAVISDLGRLTAGQAAAIAVAMAGALRAAHRAGITHRDVKPGNLLIADDGRIKLTDFGIARNVADAPMTTTGLVLGSPAYMAPEVAAGRPVTPAADLWGLGATLYAAVEGKPPYNVDGDAVKTVGAVVDGQVPQPTITGPVADVITTLMVKDPARRLPLDEVRRRLRPLLSDPDDPLFPPAQGAAQQAGHPQPQPSPREAVPARSTTGFANRNAAPLAAHPGPLPNSGPAAAPYGATGTRTTPAWRSGLSAIGLVAIGLIVVLTGITGGWALTRALAGESPLSTIATGGTTSTVEPELTQFGSVAPLAANVSHPSGWTRYNEDIEGALPSMRFVSPDGKQELRVDKYVGNRGKALVGQFTDGLTKAALGVDDLRIDERPQAVPGQTGADAQQRLRYRTKTGSQDRVTLVRIVPRGNDLWVLRLTVDAASESAATDRLFERLAAGFAPR